MPQVPIYTAEQTPIKTGSTPSHIATGVPGLEAAAEGGRNLARGVELTAKHVQDMQLQKDEVDYFKMRENHDAAMIELNTNLIRDSASAAEPLSFQNAFIAGAKTSIENTLATAQVSDRTKAMFQNYVSAKLPEQVAHAKATGLKLFDHQLKGELDNQEMVMAQGAAEAGSPNERQSYRDSYEKLNRNALAMGSIFPAEYDKRMQKFDVEVGARSMAVLGNRDFNDLLKQTMEGNFKQVPEERQAKIIEIARTAMQTKEGNVQKAFAQEKAFQMDLLWRKANNGELSDTQEQDLMDGKNMYVKAHEADAIVRMNRNPIGGGGALAVRSLIQEYNLKSGGADIKSSLALIDEYRGVANDLAGDLGAPNKLLSDFAAHLREQEARLRAEGRSLESQAQSREAAARAGRAEVKSDIRFDRQQTEQRVKDALTEYRSQLEPFKSLLGPRLGGLFTNQEIIDSNKLRLFIINNPQADYAPMIKQLIGGQKGKFDKQPEGARKTIRELAE